MSLDDEAAVARVQLAEELDDDERSAPLRGGENVAPASYGLGTMTTRTPTTSSDDVRAELEERLQRDLVGHRDGERLRGHVRALDDRHVLVEVGPT